MMKFSSVAALALTATAWATAAPQDPPKCGILTADDLKAAGVQRIMETGCSKEFHLILLLGKERALGSVSIFVGDAPNGRAKTAYEQDVADYQGLGKDAFKGENLYGEKSYRAKLEDGVAIGFLKGTHYFKFSGGGETPAEQKESEEAGRKLAKSCAARF